MTDIAEVEGIAETYKAKLQVLGVGTVERLLERGASPKGRAEMAEATGISGKLILKWVNHADLFRIKGVAGEYAELLEAAGVDTVPELAQRNADNLHPKLVETNAAKHLVRQVPSQNQVTAWIAEAKALPRVVSY
jgi:predicted flap endonuclease-1-like 5' DNA nuclease